MFVKLWLDIVYEVELYKLNAGFNLSVESWEKGDKLKEGVNFWARDD